MQDAAEDPGLAEQATSRAVRKEQGLARLVRWGGRSRPRTHGRSGCSRNPESTLAGLGKEPSGHQGA